MKKLVFILLFLILIVSFVSAKTEYRNVGSNESQFNLDRGIFSLIEELDTTYYTAGFSDTKGIPLVADMDNDGISEIYVIDEDDIEVYEDIELNFQASFDFGDEQRISYPIIYDIDGDSQLEFIFVLEEDEKMYILSFNGTDLTNESSYSLGLTGHNEGETIINCKGVQDCLIVYSESPVVCSGSSNCNDLRMAYFNSTSTLNSVLLAQNGGSSSNDRGGFCRSGSPFIAVEDYDQDSNTEYIFTFSAVDQISGTPSNAGVYIFWADVTSKTPSVEQQVLIDMESESSPFDIDAQIECYATNIGDQFSSPLVNQFLLNDPGYEVVIARQTSTTEYRMDLYDSDANFKDDFPETDDSNGILLSNVFMMDPFPVSGSIGRSFCVVGWDFDDEEQVLTCGSKFKGGFAETNEYRWTITDNYNNSFDYDIANTIAHSVQHSNALTDSIDLDEFTSTYGVFSVDDDSCSFNLFLGKYICDADRLYQNGAGKSVFYSIDVEGVGNEDLIAMTDLALYYYDDGISNRPVKQVDVFFNPCPTNTIIKLNQTMILTVTGYDGNSDYSLDNDLLQYNITLYKGTDNKLNDTETGITSGSPRQFSFNLNKTIASGLIEIAVTDNVQGNDPFIIEQSFTVGNDGVLFGDVTCTNSYSDVVPGEECDTDDDCDAGYGCVENECILVSGECSSDSDCVSGYDCVQTPEGTNECMSSNLIKRSVIEINDFLNFGLVGVWLLIMILIDIILVSNAHSFFGDWGSKYLFAIIAIIDVSWIILGVLSSVISFWLILLLIIVSIGIGVIFIANKFQGQTGV